MTMIHSTSIPEIARRPRVRQIDAGDVRWALSQGWRDFKENRGDLLVLALLYPQVGFAAAAIAFEVNLAPMLFPLVAGLSILGPCLASGYFEIARRHEAGLDSTWRHFFDPLRTRSRGGLLLLSAALFAWFGAWLLAAAFIYSLTLGTLSPVGIVDFAQKLFSTPQGWTLIVAGNLIGFLFAAVTLVASLVSFPLVVDKAVDPLTAVETSIQAVLANPGMTVLWGLRVAALLVLGCLPAFIGLAVVLPVLGYATWRLYTCLVER